MKQARPKSITSLLRFNRVTLTGSIFSHTTANGKNKYFCRACKKGIANASGGRCKPCYRKNPVKLTLVSVKPVVRYSDLTIPVIGPCPFMPGSPEKIAWMEGRVATGQPIFQDGDMTEMVARKYQKAEVGSEEETD